MNGEPEAPSTARRLPVSDRLEFELRMLIQRAEMNDQQVIEAWVIHDGLPAAFTFQGVLVHVAKEAPFAFFQEDDGGPVRIIARLA